MERGPELPLDPLRVWSSFASGTLTGSTTLAYDRDLVVRHVRGTSLPVGGTGKGDPVGKGLADILPAQVWDRYR